MTRNRETANMMPTNDIQAPRAVLGLVALTLALAGCASSVVSSHDGAVDAGSDTPTPFTPPVDCGGPPATLSLGRYPSNFVTWVGANAYTGTVRQLGATTLAGIHPAAMSMIVHVDARVYPPVPPMSDGSGVIVGEDVTLYEASGFGSLTAGSHVFFTSVGGSYDGTGTAVLEVPTLDLAAFPNALADLARLDAFTHDQAVWDAIRYATTVASVHVTSTGMQTSCQSEQYDWHEQATVLEVLCGPTLPATTDLHASMVVSGMSSMVDPGQSALVTLVRPDPTACFGTDVPLVDHALSIDDVETARRVLTAVPTLAL